MAESTHILSSYLQDVHKLHLKQLGYVPVVLEPALDSVYLLGETKLLDAPIIGIVGSPHASQQGRAIASGLPKSFPWQVVWS